MTIQEAIDARHSVRAYRNEPIEEEKRRQLDSFAEGKPKGNMISIAQPGKYDILQLQ